MSITDGNWTSATDPFRQKDVAIGAGSWVTSGETGAFLVGGLLNVIHDDEDVQRVYLRETSSPWSEIKLDGFQLATGDYSTKNNEFSSGKVVHSTGAYYVSDYQIATDSQSNVTAFLRYRNTSQSGSETFGLAAETAYHWGRRDPAQIIMAMLHHYLPNTYGGTGLRDFMDKVSFQAAASDFYNRRAVAADETGYNLSCWREVGSTVKDQVEKIVKQCVDFVGIRPTSDDGKAELHYIKREKANIVDTVVDFDNPNEGIKSWAGGVDDSLVVNEIEYRYGNWAYSTASLASGLAAWATAVDTYAPRWSEIPDLTHEEWKFHHVRRSGRSVRSINLPYVCHRFELELQWHPYWWAWEQQDLVFTHGPRHFNYEIGDVIKINSTKLGLNGTQTFLVYEKSTNYDTLHSIVRVLRVYGYEGARVDRLGSSPDEVQFWHRSESLAGQPDGAQAFIPSSTFQPKNQRLEFWLDQSGNQTGATRNAGPAATATDPGEVLRADDADSLNGWPALDLTKNTDGLEHAFTEADTSAKVLLLMCKHKTGTFGTSDEVLFRATSGFTIYLHDLTYGSTRIDVDGTNAGSGQLLNDTNWHMVLIEVTNSPSTSTWYEDGVSIGTGALPAGDVDTQTYLFSWNGLALSPNIVVAEVAWLQDTVSGTPLVGSDLADLVDYFQEKFRYQ